MQFEQLKKEQQKKSKKATGKKKSEKTADASESKPECEVLSEDADTAGPPADEKEAGSTNEEVAEAIERPGDLQRQSSVSMQSKKRSESFRQSGASAETQEIHRKQSARIEELEKRNEAVQKQNEDSTARLVKAEEELEALRKACGDVADLRAQAKEVGKLQTELASLQRQLMQAQQAAKGTQRKHSVPSVDLAKQLESKSSTVESLELEVSKLRNQSNNFQITLSEKEASMKDMEDKMSAAQSATETAQQELHALKVSIASPSDETKAANEDPEALTKRITVLESDLRTASANLEAAAKRAKSLEQKVDALSTLHRDSINTSQAKDKELANLRAQLKRRDRGSHVRDASDFDLGEEETETGALQARIRALEAENFDLRRGVWRDRRSELQPGMDEDSGAAYEDIDLHSPLNGRRKSQQHSSLQEVITSGINAFTGRPSRERGQSLELLDEDADDDFDPDAFRLAQEEEAKRRVEKVKEVKRGLEQWRAWRIDLVDVRKQALEDGESERWGLGPVFEA